MDGLIGNRCGDFLACEHRHSDSRGCGHTSHCPSCPFDQAIQAVLNGNTNPDSAQGEAPAHREAGQTPIWFKFKASGIVLNGRQAVVMALDPITERKRAEGQLHEKTLLLQNITDHMLDMVAITDLEGVFTYAGPSHRMLGFEPEQFIGTSVFDYVHPDDAAYIASEFAEFTAHPTPEITRTVEYRQRCADRGYRWLETKGKILFDDNDSPCALFFSSRDITERKRVEEALKAALEEADQGKQTLDAIMEHIPIGISIADEKMRLHRVSRHGMKMMGWPIERHVGLTVEEVLNQWQVYRADGQRKARPEDLPLARAILNGEIVLSQEIVQRHIDGRYISLTCDAGPIRDAHGRITGGVIAWQDISDRKEAIEALQESEERFKTIIENLPGGVFTHDFDGHLLLVNDAASKNTGYSAKELLSLNVEDIDSGGYTREDREKLWQSLSMGEALTIESQHTRKDGSKYPVEIHLNAIMMDRKPAILAIAFDITGRKRAEQTIRESEEKYRRIADNSADVVWTMDLDLRTTYVSPAVEKVFGETPEQHLKKGISEKLTPDSLAKVHRIFLEELENEHRPNADKDRTRFIEIEHYKADGSVIWVVMNVSFLRDQCGNVVGIQGVSRDITERRLAEEALRESEARWNFALEGAGDGVWDWNAVTNHVFYSRQWKAMLGFDENEISNSLEEWDKRIHPDDRKEAYKDLSRHFAGETPIYVNEHRIRCKNGRYKWILDRGKVMSRTSDGKPLRVIGTHTDITERKQAEVALRESEERFQKAFMHSPAPLVIAEIDTGRLIDVNDRWVQMIGYGRKDQIGRTSTELGIWINPDERDLFVHKLNTLGRFENEPVVFRNKSGGMVYALWSAELVTLAGKQVILGMLYDESERKSHEKERIKLQEQLAQAQKMESVGRLAGGVAHDYNNMLSVIVGYTEMALEKTQPDDPLHDDLKEVYKAAQRSTNITRQLLAFARKQTIDPKIIDLNDIVERLMQMLRRLIGEEIDLIWRPGKQLWPIKIDPAQVDQILVNLCVNARDAIGGVGEVAIETDNITIEDDYGQGHIDWYNGEFVTLAVSDDGCGMDRKTLDHIFEPFFTTKGISEGTGLGLPMVYGIVKQNAGFVNVYSEPGKGTTMRIYFPKHAGPQPQPPVMDKIKAPHGHGETILLVEDEPAIMRMGEMILHRLGYQVLAAGTPGQAIQMASEHKGRIDLLITDVVMPEMNGRQLSEQLNQRFSGIRTLFMSGYTANVIAHRGVLDEGMHFLQKPFSMHDLGMKIRSILDGQ